MKITLKLVVLGLLASFLVLGSAARAEYPEKPVTFPRSNVYGISRHVLRDAAAKFWDFRSRKSCRKE